MRHIIASQFDDPYQLDEKDFRPVNLNTTTWAVFPRTPSARTCAGFNIFDCP
jgi:hypothetical protein